jgi:hypothetical protein
MSRFMNDTAAWIRARGVRYELGLLVERIRGREVQIGFTISLSARLPLEKPAGLERQAAAAEIRRRLRDIVDSLVLPEGSGAQVEVDAPRAAVVFGPGRSDPDIILSARIYHRNDYFMEVTLDEETRLRRVTRQLAEWGLQEIRPALQR